MRRSSLLSMFVVMGIVLASGCATVQTWPAYERSAESKMVAIQENIGGGLESGALSPDQSQMYLSTLKGIRTDYEVLRGKRVHQEEWNNLNARIDALDDEIKRALARTPSADYPRNGDRIIELQRRIDDGRTSGRLTQVEGREYQDRIHSIRRDYMRMTENGRFATRDERASISGRLDSLENDLNRLMY